MNENMRQRIFDYVREKYDTVPDYPWMDMPRSAVLRHKHNKKWYALIMNVRRDRIGQKSEEPVDIINVKCDNLMIGSLIDCEKFFPAYHMNKANWITIILDGTAPFDEICNLIDMSYEMTV